MATFFTSDTHGYHDNIIKYCNRPFANAIEMTVVLAKNINSIVQPNDTLIHNGDWTFKGIGEAIHFREMINCKDIILIVGNHDEHKLRYPEFVKLFSSVNNQYVIKRDKRKIYFSHYSWRTWNGQSHGNWQLYGHSHSTLPDDPNALSIDIGVDTEWEGIHKKFFPYTYDELIKIMAKKTWKSIDHHNVDTPER